MKTIMTRRTLLIALAALGVDVAVRARDALAADCVLIKNAKNPTAALSKSEARKIFTGATKQWSGGSVVQVVLGEEAAPETQWLAARVFGTSAKDMLSKMKQEIFRGEMKRPVMVKSSADTAQAVLSRDGAIGVVDGATAANLPAGVVVLKMNE